MPQCNENEKHFLTTVLAAIAKQENFLKIEWKDVSVGGENISTEKINHLYHEKQKYTEKSVAILKELLNIHTKQTNLTDQIFQW